MVRVKTFSTELKIFHAARELQELDRAVNEFIAANKVARVISVSDSTTSDNTGATIGLIRVVAYEEGQSQAGIQEGVAVEGAVVGYGLPYR